MYNTPILTIPNATEITTDAAQYMIYRGKKQYNLCGHFSAGYCLQRQLNSTNIEDFLSHWAIKEPKWYQTLFKNNLARTTGVYDLEMMCSPFGVRIHRWAEVPVDPRLFEIVLQTNRCIVGVKIDNTGYLVGGGIPHWVVLEDLEIVDDKHAIVDVYNPFTNYVERYSWRELMTSTGAYKQGLWIER